MNKILENKKCSGCSACATICPKNCITMCEDDEGFLYPQVDQSLCINCGRCEKVCPELKEYSNNEDIGNVRAYSAIAKSTEMLKNSSSGGVFGLMASNVIKHGGVVFGAAFNSEFIVEHKWIDKHEDLLLLQGSKYVQSKIGEAYKQAEEFLKQGRLVYFSGTPCQIEGLLSYLRKPYNNLITQDLICHGVPSPMVWEKYIDYQKTKFNQEIERISFRDKESGWKRFSMRIQFENDFNYCYTLDKDLYLKAFLKNLCLRPSCYNCSFKTISRSSDITLADFWGVENIDPNIITKNGVSLVLVHTDKGKEILENIGNEAFIQPVELMKSLVGNSSVSKSVVQPQKRSAFMMDLAQNDFSVAKKYCNESVLERTLKLLSRIKNKLFRRK